MVDLATPGQARNASFVFPWVFSAKQDLSIAIGGMLAGFALLMMHVLLHWNMVIVWFVWVVCLDTPHFFATYYRTYLDRQEWRERKPLLLWTLCLFLIGPAMLLASGALYGIGVENFKLPWRIWGYGVSLWAYIHITRQHYGFLRLYNRKNDEIGSSEAGLDAIVLYGVLALSFVGLLASHPDLRDTFGFAPLTPISSEFWSAPLTALANLSWDHWLFLTTGLGIAGLIAALIVFQLSKWAKGEAVNLPKLVFLGTVLTLHTTIVYSGLLPAYTLLAFTAIITIYHDIQYISIVWVYRGRHYKPELENRKKFGIAGFLSRNFALFFGAALMLSFPVWGLGCAINRVGICGPGVDAGTMTFMNDTTWILFFVMLTSGLQMHHYTLDMFIWRPGKSSALRKDLGFEKS